MPTTPDPERTESALRAKISSLLRELNEAIEELVALRAGRPKAELVGYTEFTIEELQKLSPEERSRKFAALFPDK